ncbi:MAG TPA: SDR family NAD(P)-dependent oxidoreductase, partial [Desulfuromonadales bacterium]|nr:SDR family NAD(P)-dependent oxidoreductase [Desulfuromonadales bacterium]
MLSEKVAIVTGASRGIGRCIALALAAQGAKVVASARNAEALDNLVEEIKQQGGEATAVV